MSNKKTTAQPIQEFDNVQDLANALTEWLRTCSDEERENFYAEQRRATEEAMAGPDAKFFFYEDDAKRPVGRKG